MPHFLHKAVKLHPQLYFTLVFFGKYNPEIEPCPFPVIIFCPGTGEQQFNTGFQEGFYIPIEGRMPTFLSKDFNLCLVQTFIVPDVTGSPSKRSLLYILQSFSSNWQFLSEALNLYIAFFSASPGCLSSFYHFVQAIMYLLPQISTS